MIYIIIQLSKKLVSLIKEKKVLLYAGIYILCLWTIATLVFHHIENTLLGCYNNYNCWLW